MELKGARGPLYVMANIQSSLELLDKFISENQKRIIHQVKQLRSVKSSKYILEFERKELIDYEQETLDSMIELQDNYCFMRTKLHLTIERDERLKILEFWLKKGI